MQELSIDSVTHSFYGKAILNGVYLNCRIGEVVGLLGRNGSGKSTLLKAIFGSLNADFKHLKVNGKHISKGYLSGKMAYLTQHLFIPNKLTVQAAIALFCTKYKASLVQIPFIAENLKKKFRDFSGGENRLLEALIMIYSDADFVLLDEPFSQLAPMLVDQVKKHIISMTSLKGFIVTDHYYRSILDISDRVVLLHNGCNYKINNTDDLILHGYLPDH